MRILLFDLLNLLALLILDFIVCVRMDREYESLRASIGEFLLYQWQLYPAVILTVGGWWQGRRWAGDKSSYLVRLHFMFQGLVLCLLPIWMLLVGGLAVDSTDLYFRFDKGSPWLVRFIWSSLLFAFCVLYLFFAARTIRRNQDKKAQ